MNKVIIIGAGELGSRHLQGLMSATAKFDVVCVDLFEPSLLRTKKRLEEIGNPHQHNVLFSSNYDDLPMEADLAIISTNAIERLEVIKTLLAKVNLKYLVLEKVLFTKTDEYFKVQNIVNGTGVKVWVNCPRRMNSAYQQIRKDLQNKRTVITMSVKGNSWNLGSNAIHFIDLFVWMTGNTAIEVNTGLLDKEIIPSKRSGYFELSGTMIISDELGNRCVLHSGNGAPDIIEVTIQAGNEKIVVMENDHLQKFVDGKSVQNDPHVMKYQSQLTNILADDLLLRHNTSLTPLNESIEIHLPLINNLMDYFNEVTGTSHSMCPIT